MNICSLSKHMKAVISFTLECNTKKNVVTITCIYESINFMIANVHVGDTCSFQQQCNGTDHSGVCSYGVCQCQQGYLQKDGTCYRGTQTKKIDNFVTKEVSYETNICTYRMQIVRVKNISFF